MMYEPFIRPQQMGGPGYSYSPEPQDPSGAMSGLMRPRNTGVVPPHMRTGGGLPPQQAGHPMQTGGGYPAFQIPGYGMQTGGPGQMQPAQFPMRTGGGMQMQRFQSGGFDPSVYQTGGGLPPQGLFNAYPRWAGY